MYMVEHFIPAFEVELVFIKIYLKIKIKLSEVARVESKLRTDIDLLLSTESRSSQRSTGAAQTLCSS